MKDRFGTLRSLSESYAAPVAVALAAAVLLALLGASPELVAALGALLGGALAAAGTVAALIDKQRVPVRIDRRRRRR